MMAWLKTSRLPAILAAMLMVASTAASALAADRSIRLLAQADREVLPAPEPVVMPQADWPMQRYASPYEHTNWQKGFVPYQKSMVPYQKPVVGYAPPCCDQRKITYRKHHRLRRVCCDPCLPPLNMVLQVPDPCTGCPIDVPVCVPACCADLPKVCPRKGLLGRRITEFEWCCGYRIKVVVKHNGDLIVHCYGS